MEQEKFTVDYNKIQNEVKNAVKAEQRYWTENDAKFRAIAQHVPTYEDFRQIVLASHLKPLDKSSIEVADASTSDVFASSVFPTTLYVSLLVSQIYQSDVLSVRLTMM